MGLFDRLWGGPGRQPLSVPSDLQTRSYQAGLVCGQNPETPYGVKTPEGLDSVAFVAGLIEGRSQLRRTPHRR